MEPDAQTTLSDRPPLRLITCGSVDDGKSSLIGRLLYEQGLIPDDQLAALARDSKRHGTTGAEIDFALLVDGLEAEREQGITIDVAYRYFSTARRAFIVADTPGHEQYTRNMATGASNADLAILLVDARKGLLRQTFRHASIAGLLGIRHIVLAVNKIDLVEFSESIFQEIQASFRKFAARFEFASITAIPLSARGGDNVSTPSPRTPWYDGPSLLAHLEAADVEAGRRAAPFRMAVQWVNRPNLDFRGLTGTIASGQVRAGDPVVVAGSGRATSIARIVTADGDRAEAEADDSITIVLAEELDAARGDVLCPPDARPSVADQFAAHLIWMDAEKLLPGRSYLMKLGSQTIPASVTELKYQLDVETGAHIAARTLGLNEIGVCNLATTAPVVFDPYAENRETGGFILIDRATNATVAAGLIDFALRRATNIHRQALSFSREDRARLKHQSPAILWFTGLSGAGKSTIANLVEAELLARGAHTAMLDGDNVRHGLNRDLGFTNADRVENIRRVGEVAKLMTDAGLIVLCAVISPFRAERQLVRELTNTGEFIEIFVDTSLDTCIARDPKGLYRRALAGEIKNFTGIDQAYERPEAPELVLHADRHPPEELARMVVAALEERGAIQRL